MVGRVPLVRMNARVHGIVDVLIDVLVLRLHGPHVRLERRVQPRHLVLVEPSLRVLMELLLHTWAATVNDSTPYSTVWSQPWCWS